MRGEAESAGVRRSDEERRKRDEQRQRALLDAVADTLARGETITHWFTEQLPRHEGPRQPERRRGDRRSLGFQARRADDADFNRRARMLAHYFVRQLPRERLDAWVDGVLLGNATAEQLLVILQSIENNRAVDHARAVRPRRRGRPSAPLLPGVRDEVVLAEWEGLTKDLKSFSWARQLYRRYGRRTHRVTCLASPLGQRVERCGLFTALFDQGHARPGEMAARIMQRECELYWQHVEAKERESAAATLSEQTRDLCLLAAARAVEQQQHIPAWRTLYNKLRQSA